RPWLGLVVVPTNRAVPPQPGSSTARKAASSDSGSSVSRTVRFTTPRYPRSTGAPPLGFPGPSGPPTSPGVRQDAAQRLQALQVVAGQEHVDIGKGGGHAPGQRLIAGAALEGVGPEPPGGP